MILFDAKIHDEQHRTKPSESSWSSYREVFISNLFGAYLIYLFKSHNFKNSTEITNFDLKPFMAYECGWRF